MLFCTTALLAVVFGRTSFSHRMCAEVSANLCGEAEQTHMAPTQKKLPAQRERYLKNFSFLSVSNFSLAWIYSFCLFAEVKFLNFSRLNHRCRCRWVTVTFSKWYFFRLQLPPWEGSSTHHCSYFPATSSLAVFFTPCFCTSRSYESCLIITSSNNRGENVRLWLQGRELQLVILHNKKGHLHQWLVV